MTATSASTRGSPSSRRPLRMLLRLPLLSSPRNARERRASPLLLAAVLLHVVAVGASLPAPRKCPHYLDCVSQGRVCMHGSFLCGPCLHPLEENSEGRCVQRKRAPQHGKKTLYLDVDEEMEYLNSILDKQQVSDIKSVTKQSKQPGDTASTGDSNKIQPQPKSQGGSSPGAPRAATAAPNPEASALTTPTPQPGTTGADGKAGPVAIFTRKNDRVLVILISLCVAVGTVAVILATVCYVKLQNESRLAQKVDYPAFAGASAPPAPSAGASMGDKTLAQSAQMYHYQHQKQQMLSMGNQKPEAKAPESEVTSDEEEVGGDFTVYECPGLAPTGEMEVKNPLFDDSTIHYQGNQK